MALAHEELSMSLHAGDMFAGYTIIRPLGAGGMGEVYLAEHPRLPRREALKVLSSDISADDAFRQRFIREADLAAALWHPNIVRVNDRGEFNGQLWIAMDFVDGSDAATLLHEHYPVGMPADQVAAIVTAIAGALDYAHEHHNVLHRDVKPANILLAEPEAGDLRILLGDFGIARCIDETSCLTATNMAIGTVPYSAPEQLTDEPIDGRADQYALAATVYQLLTGSMLFAHTNPAVVIGRHLTARPPALAETRPMLRVFDPVLSRALAKDPADRFARCSDFAEAFARAAQSGRHPMASALTMPRPMALRSLRGGASASSATDNQRRSNRWRILAAAASVVALTALGASDFTIDNYRPAANQAPAAAAPPSAQPAAQAPPSLPPAAPAPAQAPANPPPAAPQSAPTPQASPPASRVPAPVEAAPVPTQPAPPAQQPNPDQAFINSLSQIPGITVTDPGTATATGRAVCSSLQNGATPGDAAAATVNGNSGVTPAQANAGINAAISAYCPQYLP
ncbi:serine/threonine-protein kinase [Mycobacterium intermedium]